MRSILRGTCAAIVAATMIAIPTGANASVTPDPYTTTAGTGSFTGDSAVGPSVCGLSNVAARARGTGQGATLQIRGFDASCVGVITAAHYATPIHLRVRRGQVTGHVSIMITNVLGGRCLYAGRVDGTVAHGSGALDAAGTVTLRETVTAPCAPDSGATLELDFPGAQFTW